METFLSKIIEGEKLELLIDSKIFNKDIVLKASYQFLDKGYFFFQLDKDNNIIVQFTKRDGGLELDKLVGDFSDTLLETYLRDKLEKDNKTIRETIVTKAINGPLDKSNFVTLDTDSGEQVGKSDNSEQNQIDFDKDIDEILKEIENDPDLKIDEEEIEKILKEIEEESDTEINKPNITIDTDAIKKAKDQFKK